MKQLLLRVPEDLHRRLALRARRQGRSMNALATEILAAAPQGEEGNRRARLRAAAAAAGILDATPGPQARMSARRRQRIIDSTKGLGRQLDRLLAEERDR